MAKKKNSKDPPDILFHKDKYPYRTLKTSLKSILKDPNILVKINELVLYCNHIVIDTYMFIRLFCLHKYKNSQVIPNIDSKFILYCISALGEKDNRGKKPTNTDLIDELNIFYETEFQPIFNHQKFNLRNLSYTLPYITQNMETCLSVNLKEHFVKRLLRFINIIAGKYYDKLNLQENNKTQCIYKLKKSIIENKYDEIPEIFKTWFNDIKDKILSQKITKSIAYDCQVQPFKYLPYTLFMNQIFEEHNQKVKEGLAEGELIKLFQPLSLRKSNIPKYITIDTATLINLFSEKGSKGKLLKSLKENQQEVWDKYFKMNKRIFKEGQYCFNYTIQTDGIGASLLFKHKSIKDKKYGTKVKEVQDDIHYIDDLDEKHLQTIKDKRIVTADPGKLYLLYMMDEEGKSLKYSCKQRDTESMAKRNRRIKLTNKKNSNEKIIELETELSEQLSTTVDYNKFKEYIKIKQEINMKTRLFYEQELYRKLNWRSKVYRQKSEDKFLNRIEEKFGDRKDLLICIGDWSNKQGSCIRGPSTMGIGIKKLVNKRFNTLLIDEYNTSKKCCNCYRDVENIKLGSNSKFRLLGCKGCKRNQDKSNIGSPEDENNSMETSYSFLTRDKNSCINMQTIIKHMIQTGGKRPKPFSRC